MTPQLPLPTSTLIVKLNADSKVPEMADKIRAKKLMVRAIAKSIMSASANVIYSGQNSDQATQGLDSASAGEHETIVAIHIVGEHSFGYNLPTYLMLKKFKQALQNNPEHIVIEGQQKSGTRFIEIYTRNQASTVKAPAYQYAKSGSYDFQTSM